MAAQFYDGPTEALESYGAMTGDDKSFPDFTPSTTVPLVSSPGG